MRILWLTNVPSPYRVDFFNELGRSCDLTVLFQKKTSDERDESWKRYKFENFIGVFLKGKSVNTDSAICFGALKYIKKKKYDKIVISCHSSPTGILALLKLKIRKIPYYLEVDGGFAKSGRGIKERFKHFLISGAKGYFSTAQETDKYLITYGAKKERIHRYPFTSLKEEDLNRAFLISKEDKRSLRQKLNIHEKKVILSVGRFSYDGGYGKGYDLLLKACKTLDKTVGLYIVGGEPTPEFAKMKQDLKLDNVHFIGFKNKEELSYYYGAADLFALLTRGDAWGLVINEAMSYGLPIITTFNCVAGTELVDETNGVLVDVEDQAQINDAIKGLLFDDERLAACSNSSIKKIRNYSIENMSASHLSVFEGGGEYF